MGIVLKDDKGSEVTPSWKLSGGTMCNGRTTSSRPDVVSIQHGTAPPSPVPSPTPSPSPTPTPTPTPSPTPGSCHAISPVATDDWCSANCAAGFCPTDLCKCDGVMV